MKERIIGAVVLVVFVVLVVPIFLDGPPNEGEIVSERVLLPGQDEQKTQTVVLERDRKEPVPVAAASPAADPAREEPGAAQAAREDPVREEPPTADAAKRDETVADKPATAPPPVREPVAAPPATSTTGMWAVQLGSFSNKENAEKLAAGLRKQGYAAFLSQLSTDEGVLHRVRIGPQKDRDSAEAMAARLKKVGHDGQVVPHP